MKMYSTSETLTEVRYQPHLANQVCPRNSKEYLPVMTHYGKYQAEALFVEMRKVGISSMTLSSRVARALRPTQSEVCPT